MEEKMNWREERQKSFLERIEHVLSALPRKAELPRILVLGHCIAAIEDGSGDCDIYFAPSMWRPKTPEVWGDASYPPSLDKLGLGRIEGTGSSDRLKQVEDSRDWAKRILAPVNPNWKDLWETGHRIREFTRAKA